MLQKREQAPKCGSNEEERKKSELKKKVNDNLQRRALMDTIWPITQCNRLLYKMCYMKMALCCWNM
jgi:hypothetical protein